MDAIGDYRTGSPGAIVRMRTFVRRFLANGPLPHHFSITPRDRHDDEPVRDPRLDPTPRLVLSISCDTEWYGCHQIDAIAPDHR
jgi:hypothetical protein